jgi:signal peptidase
MNKTERVLKITKKVFGVLWWGATIALALVVIEIIGAKLQGDVPRFFGYSVMQIVSGSMEDEIPTGAYILIKKVDAEDVKIDDVICFYSDDQAIRGYPNTHRVVKDPIQGPNGLEFVTKGDANPEEDGVTAKGDRLIGRYVKNLTGLTKFTKALEGNGMFMLLMALMAMCALLVILPTFIRTKQEASENDEHPTPAVSGKEESNENAEN